MTATKAMKPKLGRADACLATDQSALDATRGNPLDCAIQPGSESVWATCHRDGEIFRTAGCGAARPVVWELGLTLTGQSRRPASAFSTVGDETAIFTISE